MEKMGNSGYYKDKIVTDIVPFDNFHPAGPYHKDYYNRNSETGYCKIVIDPKIQKLMQDYNKDVNIKI